MQSVNFRLKSAAPYLVFLTVTLFFFLPLLGADTVLYSGDFTGSDWTELNIPFRYLAQQAYRQGHWPLWSQELSAGFPQAAEGQSGVFYPFNIVALYFFSLPVALNIIVISNFFLGAAFMYLWLRRLKFSAWSACLAALGFAFGGFFIFRIKHINLVNAAIWLPLALWCLEGYWLGRQRTRVALGLSLILAVQFFAGHPQMSYVTGVTVGLYFLLKFVQPGVNWSEIRSGLGFWLGVGVLTLGLAAIQLLPSLELSRLTTRSEWINYQTSTQYRFHPGNVLTLIFPYLYGNPASATYMQDIRSFGVFWESNIYFGLLGFLFALAGILISARRKHADANAFFIIFVFSAVCVFAGYTPLFQIVYYLMPGAGLFRFHQRFILTALVCLTVFAAFGFEWLKQRALAAWQRHPLLAHSRFLPALVGCCVGLVVIGDLYSVHSQYNNTVQFDEYYAAPQSAEFLRQDQSLYRISSVNWMEQWNKIYRASSGWSNNLYLFIAHRELIPPNLNVFWNISSIDDRGIFEGGIGGPKQFSHLNEILRANFISLDDKRVWQTNDVYLKLMGMQNVKYFLSFDEMAESPNLKMVKQVQPQFLPPLRIYENGAALPRAYGVFKARYMTDEVQVLNALGQADFNPATEVLIMGAGQPLADAVVPSSPAEVRTEIESDTQVALAADFPADGYVFISQIYYPGWAAYLDGQSVPILKANYAFQALAVPAGKHQVLLRYAPKSFVYGRAITLGSLLAVVFLGCFSFWHRGRGPAPLQPV